MAKFNKRKSLKEDITATDFIGKSSLPAKQDSKADDITIGLSIEEIQDSTRNLVMFKNITTGQLMGVTENDNKRAILLSHLHQWKEQSGWIAGRLLFEIQKKIEQDYNYWVSKGEKEDYRPEYTTFKQWIEKHSPTMGFGVSTANQYIWLYKNVEFEKAELGIKKMKLIQQIQDPVKREKIENEAINQKLTVQALQERIEKIEKSEIEKQEKEKKLEKINYQVITKDDEVKIDCNEDDAEFIAMAILKLEKQIKLYAQTDKAASPERSTPRKVKDIRTKENLKAASNLKSNIDWLQLESFIKNKIKAEDQIEAETEKDSKERIKATARREAFYEILAIATKEINK
jgi:hypothetical protein